MKGRTTYEAIILRWLPLARLDLTDRLTAADYDEAARWAVATGQGAAEHLGRTYTAGALRRAVGRLRRKARRPRSAKQMEAPP